MQGAHDALSRSYAIVNNFGEKNVQGNVAVSHSSKYPRHVPQIGDAAIRST